MVTENLEIFQLDLTSEGRHTRYINYGQDARKSCVEVIRVEELRVTDIERKAGLKV